MNTYIRFFIFLAIATSPIVGAAQPDTTFLESTSAALAAPWL